MFGQYHEDSNFEHNRLIVVVMIPVDTAGCLFLPRVQYAQKAYVIGCVCVYMYVAKYHLFGLLVVKKCPEVLMLLSFRT